MIETNRCKLVYIKEDDYNDVKKLYTDEKVRCYLGGTLDKNIYEDKFQNMLNSKDKSFYWIIRKKSDNRFIGLVSLGVHHDKVNTEISYQLLPEWWRKGYATETITEVINYAFNELNVTKLIAETQLANKSSIKLLKNLGMRLEQTVKRYNENQGIFSIYNSD